MKPFPQILIFLFAFCITCEAQQFLNGSFEINNADSCWINLNKQAFDSLMPYSITFGDHQSADILNDAYCQFGTVTTAYDGNWFIGLDTGHEPFLPNNIALQLDMPLIQGEPYGLSYYDSAPLVSKQSLEVGVSASDSTFGTLIYTSPLPDSTAWKNRKVIFQAPNNGEYITLRLREGETYRWIVLDDFTLSYLGMLGVADHLGTEMASCFPNPFETELQIALEVPQPELSIQVFNTSGQMVFEKAYENNPDRNFTIALSDIPKGMYFMIVNMEDHSIKRKIIKE